MAARKKIGLFDLATASADQKQTTPAEIAVDAATQTKKSSDASAPSTEEGDQQGSPATDTSTPDSVTEPGGSPAADASVSGSSRMTSAPQREEGGSREGDPSGAQAKAEHAGEENARQDPRSERAPQSGDAHSGSNNDPDADDDEGYRDWEFGYDDRFLVTNVDTEDGDFFDVQELLSLAFRVFESVLDNAAGDDRKDAVNAISALIKKI